MKARGAAVQGGLAAAGLVAAYLTWQRAPESNAGDVTVLSLSRNEVEEIRYDDGTKFAELTLGRNAGDPKVWVLQGTHPPVDAGGAVDGGHLGDGGLPAFASGDGGARADAGVRLDAGILPPSHPPIPPPPPDRQLRGNEGAEKLFEQVAPLMASRSLGVLSAEKLKELGISESKRVLDITAHGTHYLFQVAPAGSITTPYLRAEADGKVYLLGSPVVSSLDNAGSRLVERRLHELKQDDYDALRVSALGQKRELIQKGNGASVPFKLYVKDSDKPDDFTTNWSNKLWRLGPTELLGKGERPAAGEPAVQLRVDYLLKGKQVGYVELGRAGMDWYARTELTAGWSKLSYGAEDLVGESHKVMAP